jgi:hydrogenase nickel incorporation protein HypA/HybF
MHELAIAESVVATVSENVGAARVTRVVLEIGRLSGVAAESVSFCFDLCARGTALEGARLEIIETPGRARCRQCDGAVEIADGIGFCGCGSADLEFLTGRELMVREVEVA